MRRSARRASRTASQTGSRRSPVRCGSSTSTSSGSAAGSGSASSSYPYGLLTMIVSLEAIFLSTFVMISQNRADAKRQVIADQQWQTVKEEDTQNEAAARPLASDPRADAGDSRGRSGGRRREPRSGSRTSTPDERRGTLGAERHRVRRRPCASASQGKRAEARPRRRRSTSDTAIGRPSRGPPSADGCILPSSGSCRGSAAWLLWRRPARLWQQGPRRWQRSGMAHRERASHLDEGAATDRARSLSSRLGRSSHRRTQPQTALG